LQTYQPTANSSEMGKILSARADEVRESSAVARHGDAPPVLLVDASPAGSPVTGRHCGSPSSGETGLAQLFDRYGLKLLLVACDATAIFVGYAMTLMVFTSHRDYYGLRHTAEAVLLAVLIGLVSIRSQGLFLARVSSVRVVEIVHVVRALALLTGGMLLLDRLRQLDVHIRTREAVLASVLSLLLVVSFRSVYRSWIAAARWHGFHLRPIVVIGTDHEARRLINLFATHKELGMSVVAVVGELPADVVQGPGSLWRGDVDQLDRIVDESKATGVVVSPNALPANQITAIVRSLHRRGIHVQLATGISGIDGSRLRSLPLAHEPMLYVEARSLRKVQAFAKRLFDAAFAFAALVLSSPLLLAVSVAIKIDDRGPVLFRQKRVGRNGQEFDLLKFRSMAVDAEARLAALKAENERHGPLFKMVNDPRVTRVGRFLRDSSLDELPQLINVLRGSMSLVGPRPALPAEVLNFSAELRERELVLPGITGLWQVEARDNPSFDAYERLDRFYVENWSMISDLLIIVATFEHFLGRVFASIWSRRSALLPMITAEIGGETSSPDVATSAMPSVVVLQPLSD